MDNPIETRTLNGFTASLYYDPVPESPREWDNLGTMVCWHRHYRLGDEDGAKQYGTPQDFEEQAKSGKWLMLPLYLYDHSVLRISTTPFVGRAQHAEWDSGQVGYIYMELPEVLANFGNKRVTPKVREKAFKSMKQEVETYDQYMAGDVYGYEITDSEGDHVDSCWGFFGRDYALQEMQSALETAAKDADDEPSGDDLCDLCHSSGVNVERTTYCGKTVGIECGCEDSHPEGYCDNPDCNECQTVADEQDDTSVLQTPNQMRLGSL